MTARAAAEAGSQAWRAVVHIQLAATPDHADFYGLACEVVDTLRSLDALAGVLAGQVASYGRGLLRDDDGGDPADRGGGRIGPGGRGGSPARAGRARGESVLVGDRARRGGGAVRKVSSRAVRAGVVAAGVMSLAGCDDATPPTTVVVNTPPADSGQLVLITVMVGAAFLALVAAGGFAWLWSQARHALADAERARRQAEDAVLALTGQSIDRVRLELLRQPPAASRPRAGDPARREIEEWPR